MPRTNGATPKRDPRLEASVNGRRTGAGVRVFGILAVIVGGFLLADARADFTDATIAKDHRRQHMLLRRAAWRENDPLAQAELCRRYSSGGRQLADPVEAYVWCSLASYNVELEGVSVRSLIRQYDDVFGTGYRKRGEMHRRLRTAQRTEAYERIAYILSCRGASGLLALGELYHPFLYADGQNIAQSGSGADYLEDLKIKRIWLQDAGFKYFTEFLQVYFPGYGGGNYGSDSGSGTGGFSPPFPPRGDQRDFGDDREGRDPADDSAYGPDFPPEAVTPAFTDGSELPRNAIEAMTFYILAERAGHPFAGDLRDQLERELEASLRNPDDVQVIRRDAEVAADTWMPPFEIYADGASGQEGRYSDECPVTGRWESALNRMSELDVRDDQYALRWLQYYKGDVDNQTGPATRGAVKDFQLANNWHGNGRLTDYQRSSLIRLAAVSGDIRSQETLGYMYACGIGVVPDELRASHWYEQAYEQGSALAAYNLGLLHQGENATNSCLVQADTDLAVRKLKPDPNAAERYIRRAYARGFQSIDPAFRRRFDLPLRFRGSYESDETDRGYGRNDEEYQE